MSDNFRTAALEWAARGFRVFPLIAGTKKPTADGWTDTATGDAGEVARMWTDPVTGWALPYNIGVLTNDMIVVDADSKNGRGGLESLAALDLPATLEVQTPSGGLHAYYDGPNASLSVGKLGPGLDIRSYHGYVVAPGSVLDPDHPLNKGQSGAYTLLHDRPVAKAPPHLVEKLSSPRDQQNQVAAVELDTPAAIARAVDHAQTVAPAVMGQGADAHTFAVVCAVKDFGVSEFEAFCLLAEHYLPRCVAPRSAEEQVTWLETKVRNAYAYGKNTPGTQSPMVDFAGVHVTPPVARLSTRQWFMHGDAYDPPAWLYHEVLPETGVVMLVAPPGAGKTFLTTDLARSLGTGDAFFGIAPSAPGGTALLVGEGAGGVKTRINALKAAGRLPIAMTRIGLLREPDAFESLAKDLTTLSIDMLAEHGVPLRAIVLDTLSASGLLEDENDNSKAAIVMKALEALSVRIGAVVIVTHHPAKGGRGERGAGALHGSADVTLEVAYDKKSPIRALEITKSRDGPLRKVGDFTLVPVKIGQDERGNPIETCTVSTAPVTQVTVEPPRYGDLLMECLSARLDSEGELIEGERVVELEAVKEEFFDRKDGSRDRSNMNKAWKAALEWAVEAGAVTEKPFGGRRYLAPLSITGG
jgi:hypothetical protein